jgi:putative membrane protein
MSNTTKIALIIGGVILAILIIVPLVWAGFSGYGGYGWGMMGPGMMGGLMMIPMVLFWGLIIWGIIALTRGAWHGCGIHSHSEHEDSALNVLKRRYARGEISKEEFEEKKKDLA